ncbi:TPA: hypothetical protein DCE37_04290 [Candidatus Latescibacteria bacterium]|nr:hypothetical protein [Candidatus Latescibacterota bacterium]
MKMLLRDITLEELSRIFDRHPESSTPFLKDPSAIRRAKRLAKKNGVWDDITENLDPATDIPVIKRSDFRHYQRVGDRTLPQQKDSERLKNLLLAAHAVWLGHPKAHIDYLQDLLWAYCDNFTWVRAAHEDRSVDLGSVKLATLFAEINFVLGDQLEEEVTKRVDTEIRRRIFDNFFNPADFLMWKTVRMNWNHVCNGSIVRAALHMVRDPKYLASLTYHAIQHLTYAHDGFTDDGGCEEGPSYWGFGFGHYLYVAHAVHHRTGGELNLMDDPKIERICQYPLASNIAGKYRSTFADSGHGYIPSRVAITINEFYDIPELYDLCPLHNDGTLQLALEDHSLMHDLAIYGGQKAKGKSNDLDYILEDLGQVKIKGKPGKKQMTVMAIAGHNGVPHNHNDIGSFIVYREGKIHLVDPGGPKYRKATFGPQRYEIPYCNSFGHSVPLINGRMQEKGSQHFGTLATENLNGEGNKQIVIDMTNAYPEGTVDRLIRTFTLESEKSALTIQDEYSFARAPKSLEEVFITFEKATVARNRKSVQIGTRTNGVQIVPNADGAFSIERLTEAAKLDGKNNEVITRISFTPKKRNKHMTLRFIIG